MGLMTFLLGVVVLFGGLWGINAFVRANPAHLALRIYTGASVASFGLAVVLMALGRTVLAMPLVMLGFGLWQKRKASLRTRPTSGRQSTVRTTLVEMRLDHDSGAMEGRMVSGTHAGRDLRGLQLSDILEILLQCDADSRSLLEAYLDRRSPGWRQHGQADAETGRGAAAGEGPMGLDEAYQILGLQPNAGPDEIRGAYRSLMKKVHPDQGGSAYLAARVNHAKELLLRRHG